MDVKEPHVCVFNEGRNDDIKSLKEMVAEIPKAHARMNMKINVGYGIFIAGAMIVGIMMTQLDNVKADMSEKQRTHESQIANEQDHLKHKIDLIEDKIGGVEVSMAVISSQIKDYQEDLREDRINTREMLKEVRDLLRAEDRKEINNGKR